jgi:hypothetical protein
MNNTEWTPAVFIECNKQYLGHHGYSFGEKSERPEERWYFGAKLTGLEVRENDDGTLSWRGVAQGGEKVSGRMAPPWSWMGRAER